MFTRQPAPVLFFNGGRPLTPATSRHYQDALRNPPPQLLVVFPPPHNRHCDSIIAPPPLVRSRRISVFASPLSLSTRSAGILQVSIISDKSLSTVRLAVTGLRGTRSSWRVIPPTPTEPPKPPVPPDPPPHLKVSSLVYMSCIPLQMSPELTIDEPFYNWFIGVLFSRRGINNRVTELPQLSDHEEPARILHCSITKTVPLLPIGKYTMLNFPTAGFGPVVDASPAGAGKIRVSLESRLIIVMGYIVMGYSLMGYGYNFRFLDFFISPLSLEGLIMSNSFKFRHIRPFYIDFVNGSRDPILVPDKNLLSSKAVYDVSSTPTYGCNNGGIKPNYIVFIQALVLGYQVNSIYGLFHFVEQASSFNASIFTFIALLVFIVLSLSMAPVVTASSLSV